MDNLSHTISRHLINMIGVERRHYANDHGRIVVPYSKNDAAAMLDLNIGTKAYQNGYNHVETLSLISKHLNDLKIEHTYKRPRTGKLGTFEFKPAHYLKLKSMLKGLIPNFNRFFASMVSSIKKWVTTNWDRLDPIQRSIQSRTRNNLNKVLSPYSLGSITKCKVSRKNDAGWMRPIAEGFRKSKEELASEGLVHYYDIEACFLNVVRQTIHDPYKGMTTKQVRASIHEDASIAKQLTMLALQYDELPYFNKELIKLQDAVKRFEKWEYVTMPTGHVRKNVGQKTRNTYFTGHEAIAVNCLLEVIETQGNVVLKGDAIQTDIELTQEMLDRASQKCYDECGFRPTWKHEVLSTLKEGNT